MSANNDDHDPNIDGLLHIASMTNRELFTAVIAAIKRSLKQNRNNNGVKNNKDWQRVAVEVASRTARGEAGYSCTDDWVRQFNIIAGNSSSGDDDSGTGGGSRNFGDALKALPEKDCYRKRLGNACTALASSATNTATTRAADISVRQAAGLIRGSSFLTTDGDDEDSSTRDNDCELQARAISNLVRTMPQLASSNPCDIFLAVQLPLLQKLQWNAFSKGGIKFASAGAETEFRSLLNRDFGKQDAKHAGDKRKRIGDNNDAPNEADSSTSSTLEHVLEAAHLARNGAVRAQHGAVIYVPSDNKEENSPKIIGRGWNHDFMLDQAKSNKNKIVLHSECHAVADAIRNHGEDECFQELFPRATILIVELESDYTYDTCHPCPKCHPLLRSVGITNVLHTTPHGKIEELDLGSPNQDFLSNENVYIPFRAACDELEIQCKRLQEAVSNATKCPSC